MVGGRRHAPRVRGRDRGRVRGRARVGLTLVLVAAVAAWIPDQRAQRGPRLMVAGDSITVLASDALREALSDDDLVTFRHERGQTILDMLDEIEDLVTSPAGVPRSAVVNLGTNDARQANPAWREHFDAMVALLEPVPCVILVTVNEHIAGSRAVAAGINDAIDELVAADPDQFHRVEWNIDWTDEMGPGGPDDPGPHYYSSYVGPGEYEDLPDGGWIGDGLHPSPEGNVELARRYEAALVEDCGFDG